MMTKLSVLAVASALAAPVLAAPAFAATTTTPDYKTMTCASLTALTPAERLDAIKAIAALPSSDDLSANVAASSATAGATKSVPAATTTTIAKSPSGSQATTTTTTTMASAPATLTATDPKVVALMADCQSKPAMLASDAVHKAMPDSDYDGD